MPANTENSEQKLSEILEKTLKQWRKDKLDVSPLRHLYLARAFCHQDALSPYQAVKKVVDDALSHIEAHYPLETQLLRRHYFDGESVPTIGRAIGLADSTVYRTVSQGRKQLENQIQKLEEDAKSRYWTEFSKRLEPPTYTTLIGLESAIHELNQIIVSSTPPWIVSIEGLGGIGKTALADAFARHLLDRGLLYDLAWVTARQSIFSPGLGLTEVAKPALTSEALMDALYSQLIGLRPSTFTHKDLVAALTRLFKAHPYLVFIDNLETVIDVETLLPTLRGLAGPTRFVLTTRHSLYGQSDIFPFAQNELSKADALRLLRQEAHTHNLPQVTQATDSDLNLILERTGGNPLAIKLVVGLLHIHSLDEILADLLSARSSEVNQFYDYIYVSSWARLSELEQNTLLAMPLVDELGGTLDDLAGVSRIDRNELHSAIEQLARLNLVNPRGGLHESRYTIHSLTRSFIHRKIVEWEE